MSTEENKAIVRSGGTAGVGGVHPDTRLVEVPRTRRVVDCTSRLKRYSIQLICSVGRA